MTLRLEILLGTELQNYFVFVNSLICVAYPPPFTVTLMCVCVREYLLWAFYVGAIRRNKLLTSVMRSEVEDVVKIWLRYACDRDGGRRFRSRQLDDRHAMQSRSNVALSESDVED